MSKNPRIAIALAVWLAAAEATAQPLDLPVWRPGVSALGAAAYRGDRLSIRLSPEAARAARARVAAWPARGAARPAASALGIAAIDRVAQSLGGAVFEPEFRGETPPADPEAADFTAYYLVRLPPGADLADALARFRGLREVRGASPIGVTRTSGLAALALNDSLLLTTGGWWLSQPSGRDIGAAEAWQRTVGDTSVVVAILDTGVIPYHPDLGGTVAGASGQMWVNWAERGGAPGVDDDGNGFVDDVSGWDFVALPWGTLVTPGEDWSDEDGDPNDFVGHGTSVAGLAGAIAGNGIGTAGAAWEIRLMPVRVGWSEIERQTGVIDMSYLAQAIRYATRTGADVINISLATLGLQELGEAVTAAVESGVVVVVAAGNQGTPNYLAPMPGVITVAATDRNDVVPVWSNVSLDVDLCAPGAVVGTTTLQRVGTDSLGLRQGGYVPDANGTSFATPLVSAAAALVQASRAALGHGPLSSADMEQILRLSTDDIAAQNPGKLGYGTGRLDIGRAMDLSEQIAVGPLSAGVVGGCVLLPVGTGPPWLVCAAADGRLYTLEAPSLKVRRILALGHRPAGGVSAGDLGGGLGLGVFVGLESGAIQGLTGSGRRLPGWPVQARPGVNAPALGDLDGDGQVEIVHGAVDGGVWSWTADGRLRPGFPVALSPFYGLVAPLALADLDGAPGLEIVAAIGDGTIHALRSDGSELPGWPVASAGRFIPSGPVVTSDASGPTVVVAAPGEVRGIQPSGVLRFSVPGPDQPVGDPAVGDLGEDGAEEIVIASHNRVLVLDGEGDPYDAGPWPLQGQGYLGEPVIGQVDGNAGQEIVVPGTDSLLVLTPEARRLTVLPPVLLRRPTWAEVASDPWLIGGDEGARGLIGLALAPGPSPAAAHWPTPRGNFARTGSRLGAPGMAEVAPDPVGDLAASATTDTSVTLLWTATGDDGDSGRVDHWTLRAEEWPILGASSAREWTVPGETPAGAAASATLAPLEPATRYRFTIIAVDRAGQRSLPSNQPIVRTGISGPLAGRDGPGLAVGANPTGAPLMFYWRLADPGTPGRAPMIRVHDVSGRLRAAIDLPAEPFGITSWDGRDDDGRRLAAGLYFATLIGDKVEGRARLALVPR